MALSAISMNSALADKEFVLSLHHKLHVITCIIALKASGRDCTNKNELLHKIEVLQRYAMHLFVFTRKLLQAIRWRSK